MRVREQIEMQRALCERLEAIALHFRAASDVSTDEFLQTIEAITMTENYFTPEQLALINRRRAEAGDELLRERQEEWAALIAEVRSEMEAGTNPKSEKVRKLAERWQDMVQETTAGDPAIKAALKKLWDEQGDSLAAQYGSQYDPRPVFGYITTANEAMRQK